MLCNACIFHRLIILGLIGGLTVYGSAKAELMYGVSDDLDQLVSFDSSSPGSLRSAISISGLASGEQIRSIDWISGSLYGLGSQNHLYNISTTTGFASPVGLQFSPLLNGIDFGLNAGPGGSLLYMSSDLGQNFAINPITGQATVGPNYTGASLDSLAYNFLNGTFVGIDAANHNLYNLNPTTGATSLIGATGVNFSARVWLDISPSSGTAYFSGSVNGQSELFTVNLTTGALTLIGDIGTPGDITSGLEGIAATGINVVPEPPTVAFFAAGGSGLLLWLWRQRRTR